MLLAALFSTFSAPWQNLKEKSLGNNFSWPGSCQGKRHESRQKARLTKEALIKARPAKIRCDSEEKTVR